jgi:hypothetical protein
VGIASNDFVPESGTARFATGQRTTASSSKSPSSVRAHTVGNSVTRPVCAPRCWTAAGGLSRVPGGRERRGEGSAVQGNAARADAKRFDLKTATWRATTPRWRRNPPAGLIRPCEPQGLLLFDAFNPDDAVAGVFIDPNVRLKLLLFHLERLERVHVRELYEHHAIGRRCSPEADHFVEAASEALATKCFDVALRLGQIVLGVGVLICNVDFSEQIRGWLGLRVQNAGGANA